MMTNLDQSCRRFGLKISITKTEVMAMDSIHHVPLNLQLDGSTLKQTDKFRYLGSAVTSKGDLDSEINSRIGAALIAFGRLQKRVFRSHDV